MKQISIQDLKARLSAAIAEAESGETLVVTRHSEPVAQLGPPKAYVRRRPGGALSALKPAIKPGTAKVPYLEVLRDDRGNR
jgi:prevent-host-death family protein